MYQEEGMDVDIARDSSGSTGSSSGEEAENEYFYRDSASQRAERRRRRREDATFGVFGDEEGEEEGKGRGFGGLGFVSFVHEGEELGTGHVPEVVKDTFLSEEKNELEEEEEEEEVAVTGAFGRKVRKAAAERREREWGGRKKNKTQDGGAGGEGKTMTARGVQSEVGTFEAHTKGIGAKLLSKMGWKEGQGLGKDGKGLSQPLEASLRPKRQGMGFGNRREPSLAPKKEEKEKKAEVVVDVQKEAHVWRKQRADFKLKEKKQIFKTVDDVLASSDGSVKSSIQTIIDMRGPQKRIIHDVGSEGALLERHRVHDEGPLPELQHNMRLLVDLNEAEIKKVHARITHSKNTKTLLEKERRRLMEQKSSADARKKNLAHAVSHATRLRDAIHKGVCSFSAESRKLFSETKVMLGHDYYRYQFHLLAAAVIQKPLGQQAHGWSPLEDPTLLLPQISEWKALLTSEDHSNQFYPDQDVDIDGLFASSDPFMMLIVDVVLPKLRSDIQSSWDPKDSDTLEVFLDSWRSVLPNDVILYVMQHIVLPKLRSAVEKWDPLVDEIAPHMWLLPPLPYLGNHAKDLWPIVRMKFISALSQWHPSDPTALEMLKPWKRVFTSHDWDHLCSRAIEPKLSHVLENEFVIHASDQDLEPFSWVMAWDTEIRPERFAKLLDRHFFPKWRAALRQMLVHSPNFDEIARWYLLWKSYMSDEVLETSQVAKNIEAALNDMNRALAGEPLEPTWTSPIPEEGSTARPPLMKLKASQRAQLTMKELIAQFAEDAGVDFIPKLGRMHEGLQVYHFGLVLCAVNTAQETIVAQIDPKSHTWKNVSLDELLDENDKRLRQIK